MRSAPSATAWEMGVLLTTPPSISRRCPIATGGKIPGIDADAAMASTAGPLGEEQLTSLGQVEREQMERDGRLAEVIEFDVPPDQPPQLAIGHKMVTSSARTAGQCAHAHRKDVLPLEVAPHPA